MRKVRCEWLTFLEHEEISVIIARWHAKWHLSWRDISARYLFPIFDASKTNTATVLSNQRQTTNTDVTLFRREGKEKYRLGRRVQLRSSAYSTGFACQYVLRGLSVENNNSPRCYSRVRVHSHWEETTLSDATQRCCYLFATHNVASRHVAVKPANSTLCNNKNCEWNEGTRRSPGCFFPILSIICKTKYLHSHHVLAKGY